MGLWSAYFFAKLLLYAGGYIDFHVWWNFAFAVLTALPPQNANQRFAKNLVAVPLGILLLYHDSWLPPVARVAAQAGNLSAFTLPYVFELLGRFLNWKVIASLVVLGFFYFLARRKLRLSTFAFIGILCAAVLPRDYGVVPQSVANSTRSGTSPLANSPLDARNMRGDALDDLLARFNAQEQQRQVRFEPPAVTDQPYDIVLLHVCSLSWDDLQAARAQDDPLFDRFDIVFSQFNSAASYSGPAALRLLRGNCGESTHKKLYEPASRECLVIDGLQNAGFEPHWLMNHDGHFGDFFTDVRDRAKFPVPPAVIGDAAIAQHSFDGTPIYGDYSVLSRWWSKRLANPAERVVLYYNTISLHDGNRVVGGESTYKARLTRFTADMTRFLDDVQRSQRRVVVVFIPEHGAAVRGDRKQIPGLREIPTPAITHVPVGITLVNAPRTQTAPSREVEAPTSYLAVNELLSRFLKDDPFAKPSLDLAPYTENLPQTNFVAENEGTVMLQIGERFMMRTPDGEWSAWD